MPLLLLPALLLLLGHCLAAPTAAYDFGLNLPTRSGTSGTGAFLPGVYSFNYSSSQLQQMRQLGFTSIRLPVNIATANNAGTLTQMRALVEAVEQARADGVAVLVYEAALLFETGGDRNVDLIVVVSAAPDVQRARVLARPGMTAAKFAAILARQLPDAEKRARADHVIATDVSIDETRDAVRQVIACLTASTRG